jgi:hypothetical protein
MLRSGWSSNLHKSNTRRGKNRVKAVSCQYTFFYIISTALYLLLHVATFHAHFIFFHVSYYIFLLVVCHLVKVKQLLLEYPLI